MSVNIDYWIPGPEEHGLLEVVSNSPEQSSVAVHSRPEQELKGNFFDYYGGYCDLSDELFVRGRAERVSEALNENDYYKVSELMKSTEPHHLVLIYRDYSTFAVRTHKQRARGGFGNPVEGSFLGFTLNPFTRSYVDQYFICTVGRMGPATLTPIGKRKYVAATQKSHENYVRNNLGALTDDQLDEVMRIDDPDIEEQVDVWSLQVGVKRWPLDQQVAAVACFLISIFGFVMNRPAVSRMRSACHTLLWMVLPFSSSVAASLFVNKSLLVPPEAPFITASSGLFSLSVPTSSGKYNVPLFLFTVMTFVTSLRFARLTPSLVSLPLQGHECESVSS
eukprot:TRINITY_DN8949_c0_g4_i1.p1 TRINITY_DN8949_c0_g4~~TRINITY_DN8949_c0_g4_i1.p1  ORF type:complete len:342 (+),score=38.04 TRINITY_DN8949_c0_g4_i1:23-1027(+)